MNISGETACSNVRNMKSLSYLLPYGICVWSWIACIKIKLKVKIIYLFTSTWNHPDAFSTSPLIREWIDFGMGEPRLRNVVFFIFDVWITSAISSSSSKRARIPISAARNLTLFCRPWPVVLKLTRRFAPDRIVKSWPDGFRSRSSCSEMIEIENRNHIWNYVRRANNQKRKKHAYTKWLNKKRIYSLPKYTLTIVFTFEASISLIPISTTFKCTTFWHFGYKLNFPSATKLIICVLFCSFFALYVITQMIIYKSTWRVWNNVSS